MKIAVVGSGISGLSSAYYLSKKYKVDLFEQNSHLGGHSYTYDIQEKKKTVPVDLGFIVFNELTYLNLIKFFNDKVWRPISHVTICISNSYFFIIISINNINHTKTAFKLTAK